ncbi:MAG: dihydrofolate reductase [Ignavibacteria bacterium RIFOXYB2_FULL_35_12]|nr:MAG: dihydrofolate reductase [Ignavibacteria bacterium GWA2_36_19]OGU62596.1 MAG: dihydrofolate reductase [Ignavibacteria bacterium GWF2_35_20]OGU79409.1 MAG: dihydrofolate reductase [Ignavibacteria bacterium RIFOXYA2_FULL_35_9]OGU89637.1 MAG: dihydrofolate reductase [Ignavibacteria bacterium RIFOXYA12_FULL_35_25]OGU94667.1 MAG: dihydrofolate reductase [Ignavibacteria bacterium RIFOXYB12_FULL_35_14]OGV01655.1 MAG: dihydrofolate reductase [Ignavibacteria bacterium RIFOXYC2_FULL_35_16]OGV039
MKKLLSFPLVLFITVLMGCGKSEDKIDNLSSPVGLDTFKYQTEQFADLAILRYQVPGFEELSLKEKELVYYLYEAALAGRDIYYDQNYKHNLFIRKTLNGVVRSYEGDRQTDEFKSFMVYAKRFWFSNGIHHHYANKKFTPEFSPEYFTELLRNSDEKLLPIASNETLDNLLSKLIPLIFNPNIDAQKVNLTPGADLIKTSAVNFYEGTTQKEVENFYSTMVLKKDTTPVWHGLNSKLIKEKGKLQEKVWKVGGMYSQAIEKIVYWLGKALRVAENDLQKNTLQKLIDYYKTGDLKAWDDYNILWVQDTTSRIDVVNGFIEVYDDPLGYKGSYEAIVSIKDLEATQRIDAISRQAQWFEDNSTLSDAYKKKNVVGISAKVITVVVELGDASPSTPIGINLPNSNWIRKIHGSKSVNLGNIVNSYNKAGSEEVIKEFYFTEDEIQRAKEFGALADNLHTDLHEVIGHASGQIKPGVGTPKQTLKNYASVIEEARADLVALYYAIDQKLVDIGVMPSIEVGKAEYNKYIRNGLMLQLNRIEFGENIEQAHMRNRQLVSKWVYEKGKNENVIERKIKEDKTYFVINDYQKLRQLFGVLLRDVQRITSEGDYEAAKKLVETYGVEVDKELHKEVKERYARLNIAPYKGFINPVLKPIYNGEKIVDVKIEYPEDFVEQMLYYDENYSFLPVKN